MTEIYGKYLSAIRSFVTGAAPEAVTSQELGEILALAKSHSTSGIVCYVYMSHPEQAAAESLGALRRQCLSQISLYGSRAELAKLLAANFLFQTGSIL